MTRLLLQLTFSGNLPLTLSLLTVAQWIVFSCRIRNTVILFRLLALMDKNIPLLRRGRVPSASEQYRVCLCLLQVAVIQYSDTPRMEIPLGQHQSGAKLIQAIQSISYLGGNTQAGQHALSAPLCPSACRC